MEKEIGNLEMAAATLAAGTLSGQNLQPAVSVPLSQGGITIGERARVAWSLYLFFITQLEGDTHAPKRQAVQKIDGRPLDGL